MGRQNKIIFLSLFFVYFLPAYGQEVRESPPIIMPYGMGAQYYVYLGAEKGLQINVQAWGQILRPGMYSVPKTTDVIGLISFAGGPTEDANLSKVRLIRSNPGPEVVVIDLKKYMETGETSLIPVLRPGDTIIVPENISRKFSRLVQIVAQLAIIANVYYLFFERQ